jgi:hypothetical protein
MTEICGYPGDMWLVTQELNSEDQQFHENQQNDQSHFNSD